MSESSAQVQEEENVSIVVRSPEVTLYGTEDPTSIVESAVKQAEVLKGVLVDKGLTSKISGREHVRIEGWTLLGTFLGVFPVEVFTRPIPTDWRDRGMEKPEGYEAQVEARTRDGSVVGAANARCLFSEQNWSGRPDFALASMAQTRAASKALRLPLGFIVALAGYEVTPYEEADGAVIGNGSGGGSAGDAFDAAKPAEKKSTAKRSTAKKPAAKKDDATPKDEPTTSSADTAALMDLWKEATVLYGGKRAEVVKAIVREFPQEFPKSVNPRDVTADHLTLVIGLAKEASS